MEFKFIDCMCSIGKKHVAVPGVEYSKDNVKKMLQSVNVVKAFCNHYGALASGAFSYNRIIKEEIGSDNFFMPSYTFMVNYAEENPCESFEKIMVEDKVKMVNMNPASHKFSMDIYEIGDYFDVMDKLKTVITIPGASVSTKAVSELLKVYKNINIIITNISFSNCIDYTRLMRDYENIAVDTSLIPLDGIENTVNKFGSHRVVFSSYAPEYAPEGPAGRIILSSISREDKDNIAYKNILRMAGEELK